MWSLKEGGEVLGIIDRVIRAGKSLWFDDTWASVWVAWGITPRTWGRDRSSWGNRKYNHVLCVGEMGQRVFWTLAMVWILFWVRWETTGEFEQRSDTAEHTNLCWWLVPINIIFGPRFKARWAEVKGLEMDSVWRDKIIRLWGRNLLIFRM